MVPPAFSAALRHRAALHADDGTDALRLLDAAGDGPEFAGLILEDFAGRWLAQTDDRFIASPPDWLREVRPAPVSIYWKRLEKSDRKVPPIGTARRWRLRSAFGSMESSTASISPPATRKEYFSISGRIAAAST